MPGAAVQEIQLLGAAISSTADGIEVHAATREQANSVIDKIRAGGGMIESVAVSNSSLEDVFMRTLQAGKAA